MTPPAIHTSVYAESPVAWRQWLAENYATETSVWLAIYKKGSGKPSVAYDQAVDEALCFGWIDSAVRKGNEQYYFQFFTRRNPKSSWSGVNKDKVSKLMQAGKMTEAGMAMVDLAKQTGTWTALDEVEKLICPPDLAEEFDRNPIAKRYFEAFPKSVKRAILEWLQNARTLETRTKRLSEIVTLAARNERANQYRPKPK